MTKKQATTKKPARSTFLDLTEVEREQNEAVRALVKLLDMSGLPDFIVSGVCMMLAHAATAKGVDITTETGTYNHKSLGVLFAVTSGYPSGLEFEPKRDLASLISGVMNHPDTPVDLYNAMGDAIPAPDADTAEYIRLALLKHAAERKGGAE